MCILAGALAGFLALSSQRSTSRKMWTVFTLTRALDFAFTNAVNKGYFPKYS